MRRYKPAQKKDDESLSPQLLDKVIDDQVRRGVAPLAPVQPTLIFVPRASVSSPVSAVLRHSCIALSLAPTSQVFLLMIGKVQRAYNYVCIYTMAMMIVRMLGLFEFHKSLAIVTRTLSLALTDLLHFGVVFLLIIGIYAFAGYTLVGRQSAHFQSFTSSVITLCLVALGEFSTWEEIQVVEKEMGPFFFFSYIVLVTVLMVNIVLAIVVDAFMRSQERPERTALIDDVYILMTMDIQDVGHRLRNLSQCKALLAKQRDGEAPKQCTKRLKYMLHMDARNLIHDLEEIAMSQLYECVSLCYMRASHLCALTHACSRRVLSHGTRQAQ